MKIKNLKPFDLEKAKQGAKVVTRDGRPVRFICWDKLDDCDMYPIVALVKDKDVKEEEIETYTLDGACVVEQKHDLDLFMAPTVVERWVNVYKNKNEGYFYGRYYDSEQEALENYIEYKNAKYIATAKIVWEE